MSNQSHKLRTLGYGVDTSERWHQSNPIIPINLQVIESDTGLHKCGDGVSRYTELSYYPTFVKKQDLTIYITTDGDDKHTGLTKEASVKTLARSIQLCKLYIDIFKPDNIYIEITDSYTLESVTIENWNMCNLFIKCTGGSRVQFNKFVISASNVSLVNLFISDGLIVSNNSLIKMSGCSISNIVIDTNSVAHISGINNLINPSDSNIAGISVINHSQLILTSDCNIKFSGIADFTINTSNISSAIINKTAVLTGDIMAYRYKVNNNSILDTDKSGPNRIPGTFEGTVDTSTGGIYV